MSKSTLKQWLNGELPRLGHPYFKIKGSQPIDALIEKENYLGSPIPLFTECVSYPYMVDVLDDGTVISYSVEL